MIVEIFTICDYAQEHQGKLFINGTFDSIWSREFPFVHPALSIPIKIRFSNAEIGQHIIKVKIINLDGTSQDFNVDVTIQTPSNGLNYTSIQFVANLNNLQLTKAGKIAFELYVDEELIEGITLSIIQAK